MQLGKKKRFNRYLRTNCYLLHILIYKALIVNAEQENIKDRNSVVLKHHPQTSQELQTALNC